MLVVVAFCIYSTRYAIFNAFHVCVCALHWDTGACGFFSKCYTRYIFWTSHSLFKVFSNVWSFETFLPSSLSSHLQYDIVRCNCVLLYSFEVPTFIYVTFYTDVYCFSFSFCCLHNWPMKNRHRMFTGTTKWVQNAHCTIQRAFHTCGALKWLEWVGIRFRPKNCLSMFVWVCVCVRNCM